MKIKSLLLVLLIFVFALGSCESKKEEQKAAPQVSKETPKPKPVEAAPSRCAGQSRGPLHPGCRL